MSVHRNIIPNYSQQDATFLDLFISTDALHVSGGSSARHHLYSIYIQKAELIAFSKLSDIIVIVTCKAINYFNLLFLFYDAHRF
jgi:hypothetical protein